MSISIKVEPSIVQPVKNQIILVLDSTKKTETDFEFRTDIKKSDGTLLSRLKHSTNPDGFGVIDLHKHLENEVTLHIPWTGNTTFQRAPHNYIIYELDLAELYRFYWTYNSVSGTTGTGGKAIFSSSTNDHFFNVNESVKLSSTTETSYSGVTLINKIVDSKRIETTKDFKNSSSGDTGSIVLSSLGTTVVTGTTELTPTLKYGFNGVINWEDVPDWSFSKYLLTGSTSKFLTSLPNNYNVEINDQLWFNIYNGSGNTVSALEVISDNGKFHISNPFSGLTDDNRFLTVGVGPYNLNNSTSPIKTISGSTPVIPNKGQYTIQTVSLNSGATSEIRTFKMVSNCSKYEIFRIVFLDKLGSLISVTFNKVSRKNITVVKTNYKQNFGKYNSVNNTWGYNKWDRGKKRLSTIKRDRFTITSDWVSESVGNLISELIPGSEAYHLDEDGIFRAIDILTTEFEERKRVNEKLINYQIDFEYSFINPAQ